MIIVAIALVIGNIVKNLFVASSALDIHLYCDNFMDIIMIICSLNNFSSNDN
jgi:hypothetical protein